MQMPAENFGHYRLIRPLGEGGMGQVYEAEDASLGRRVALKILPPETAGDQDFVDRFRREARALAALHHPNIVTIFSADEVDGRLFLTMELVDGPTLESVVRPDGLPLRRLLDIALPIADALGAAHDRGIVHRDLKPGNVMLSKDGSPKILDFGLAKSVGPRAADASTVILRTAQGQVVGTVPYMSPEQAEGQPVDTRSDIFSFGILLYELATGTRPFQGSSVASVYTAILTVDPQPVHVVRDELPRQLGRIIQRALAKDPERRYQSVKDLRADLDDLRADYLTEPLGHASTGVPVPRVNYARALLVGVIAATFVVTAWWTLLPKIAPPGPAADRWVFSQLTWRAESETFPSLSPDGKWFVFTGGPLIGYEGQNDIFLQSTGGDNRINLTADFAGADYQPAFSPDGELIAFRSERQGGGVFVMRRTGENVRRVSHIGFNPAWSPDGRSLVVSTRPTLFNPANSGGGELWIVPIDSGLPRRVGTVQGMQPSWSPDGKRIAYWSRRTEETGSGFRDIDTIGADGTNPQRVTNDPALDWNPAWSPDGRYLYFTSDRTGTTNLWRQRIEESTGSLVGDPEGVSVPVPFAAHVSFSSSGEEAIFASFAIDSNVKRIAFDSARGLTSGPPSPVTTGSRDWEDFSVAPDGDSVALTNSGPQEDLFVVSADGDTSRQLTADSFIDRGPTWAPDGKRIAFYSNRSGEVSIWTVRPDGGDIRQVTQGETTSSPVWSPDGSLIAAVGVRASKVLAITPEGPLRLVETLPALPSGGKLLIREWSPDGRWLIGSEQGRAGLAPIVLYDRADRTYRTLTTRPGTYPTVLPDKQRIIFASLDSFLMHDFIRNKTTPLLTFQGALACCSKLSPDSRWLYFIAENRTADIWMMKRPPGQAVRAATAGFAR